MTTNKKQKTQSNENFLNSNYFLIFRPPRNLKWSKNFRPSPSRYPEHFYEFFGYLENQEDSKVLVQVRFRIHNNFSIFLSPRKSKCSQNNQVICQFQIVFRARKIGKSLNVLAQVCRPIQNNFLKIPGVQKIEAAQKFLSSLPSQLTLKN
jgi:hypothetical protein